MRLATLRGELRRRCWLLSHGLYKLIVQEVCIFELRSALFFQLALTLVTRLEDIGNTAKSVLINSPLLWNLPCYRWLENALMHISCFYFLGFLL
jgi:hypothetical protein